MGFVGKLSRGSNNAKFLVKHNLLVGRCVDRLTNVIRLLGKLKHVSFSTS